MLSGPTGVEPVIENWNNPPKVRRDALGRNIEPLSRGEKLVGRAVVGSVGVMLLIATIGLLDHLGDVLMAGVLFASILAIAIPVIAWILFGILLAGNKLTLTEALLALLVLR
jgi:hypothetical protein